VTKFLLSQSFFLCSFPVLGTPSQMLSLLLDFPLWGPHLTCRVCFLEYILGTVHKAKGLEFDTVHVLDDFVKVPCARHNLAQLPHFRVGKDTGRGHSSWDVPAL
jgi:hypothetical protein